MALYNSEMSLQAIGDALNLNPIKVRKLLITAGVYESDVAEKVKNTFEKYRETQDYKTSILSTAKVLKLSKASITSYLPFKKGVYFPSTEKEKISVGAERQRRYRAMKRWRADQTEENFWGVVVAYAGAKFKTYSGLPFSYEIKKGRNGEYTKELWIDRREKSKSLAWNQVRVGGKWYILDAQSGGFLLGSRTWKKKAGTSWDTKGLPTCSETLVSDLMKYKKDKASQKDL